MVGKEIKMKQNFLNYLLVSIEDDNGQLSGKRVLGTLCIITALILTSIVSYFKSDKIAEQTMLIAPAFATGLMFWGLTSAASYYHEKLVSNDSISKKAIDNDSDNPEIKITNEV